MRSRLSTKFVAPYRLRSKLTEAPGTEAERSRRNALQEKNETVISLFSSLLNGVTLRCGGPQTQRNGMVARGEEKSKSRNRRLLQR
jgi:hypothetical protein